MKATFTAPQKELISLLSSMQPICNKRTTMDVTESILFQLNARELTLKATDLEISLQTSMLIESDVIEPKVFLVPGKRIFELVKEMEGDIAFTIDEASVNIKAGAVDLSLNIKNAEEFPPFPERIENLMEMESSFFLGLLDKVAFLIPQNNANPALNGMLFEITNDQMAFVATDGHCLAQVTSQRYTSQDERKWLLPKKAVIEIKKILEGSGASEKVFIGVCGNQLVFSGKNFNFFTRLIADQFPHYKPVLDREGFMPARIARDSFLKTLKRASCLLAGQFVSTNFAFVPGALNVSVHNKEIGKLEECLNLEEFSGSSVESRFYSPYLLNGLQVFPAQQVNFFIKSPLKPIIFESHDQDCNLTYLVMPVSTSQP
ncbi:DNA polymerase III subunit beta [Candidatus Dependentiae bacterium]|nr:DNA polymerase III subunit beta [Candidatus Dependentiae bacterium]